MKLKPYKEVLKMCKEKIDDVLAGPRAQRAKKQAELEICKLEESICSQEQKINELCMEKDLDFKKIIDAQDQLALSERRKKQFVKIINEMFPED